MTPDELFTEGQKLTLESLDRWAQIQSAMFDAKHNLAYAKTQADHCRTRLFAVAEGSNQKQRDAWVEEMLATDEEFLTAHAAVKEHEADLNRLEIEERQARVRGRQGELQQQYVIAQLNAEVAHG